MALPSASETLPVVETLDANRTHLVTEDFEDGKIQMVGYSANSERWKIVDDSTGNKVFRADNREGNEYPAFSFGEDGWTDYSAEYRVKYLAKSGSVGLQVRSDGGNYYVTDLSVGELYLAYPTPKEWVRMTTKFPSIQLNKWHTVRVTVQGETIQVSIDGNPWIDENDSRYKNGWLLMFASPGTYAQVDDIKAWETKDALITNTQIGLAPTATVTQSLLSVMFQRFLHP
jgi:hypothetical protein